MASISRREMIKAALFAGTSSASGWFPAMANAAAEDSKQRRHCILLWMNGGPSQLDTFDLKPGHANGGPFQEITTDADGLRISEHLPRLAKMGRHLAVIRSLSTNEGDHGRGSFLMRTGHSPTTPIRYPSIGASLSKELSEDDDELPGYVSISPYRAFSLAAYGSGFLGAKYAPLTVGATDSFQPVQATARTGDYAQLVVDDLEAVGDDRARFDSRLDLWQTLQDGFKERHKRGSAQAHDTTYHRAVRMMRSRAARAFDLSQESNDVRQAYGKGRFGQGCLMARRLIEAGVPFVEVSLGDFAGGSGNWDTHANNFPLVKTLSAELDAGWSTLMQELEQRGLLESTTILWMGEFGRTPRINNNKGRDHYSKAWSCVLAGGGIRGGQVHGRTSKDGLSVEDQQVSIGDVLATLCRAVDIDPQQQNTNSTGRPFRIAEGKPIKDLLK